MQRRYGVQEKRGWVQGGEEDQIRFSTATTINVDTIHIAKRYLNFLK
jgi:hypothetical protein